MQRSVYFFSNEFHSKHVLEMSDMTQMGNPEIKSLASAWLQGMLTN